MTRLALFAGLTLIAVLAVGYTFTVAVQYSAFAAALAKVTMAVILFYMVDRFLLPEIDTLTELKDGNIAYAIFLLALALLLAPAIATGQPYTSAPSAVVDTAEAHVGVQETADNSGPKVERYLASVGLGAGYPWCAAFVSYVLDAAHATRPSVRSARSLDFVTRRSLDATDVLRGTARPAPGALAVYRRGDAGGHIGIVTRWKQDCGETISGNTSAARTPYAGRDGEGVYQKRRCIRPGSYFRLTHFTPTDG